MVDVLGYGTPWKGYLHRMRVLLEALHRIPNEEVVVLVDAFDTIIQKTAGLQEAFLAFDCAVLVSSEQKNGLSKWIPAAVFKHYQSVGKVKKKLAFKLLKFLVCYCNIWQQSCEPEMNSYE
jgi:hypothetical protein